jgi:histidine triad (HIT) family protein
VSQQKHAHKSNCIFCKIVAGEIPSVQVLETDHAIALLDINPVNPGHVLLVSKDHHENLAALPDHLAASVAGALPRLCRAVQAATGAHGLNIIVNMGKAAGQTIDHLHWHVIPRFEQDAVNWPWPHSQYVGDELSQMQFRIQRELDPKHEA